MTNSIPGVIATILDDPTHPSVLLSWAALHDLLEAEEAPPEVLRVCTQAGVWIGTREDWEREGPLVVDVVPVGRVWVLDVGLRYHDETWVFYTYETPQERDRGIDPDDLPSHWHPYNLTHEFDSVADAQAWLTQIALDYARRVRDGKQERQKGKEGGC